MTLTVGSLFSGIGGLDLGLERAGMTVTWQSEIDPYASRVLAKHWPHVPNLGDITRINWAEVPHVDLICGGYPCQPFSVAGRQLGNRDPRHLWPWMLDAIRVLRPRYALLENVSGHLSLGFGRVLGDLAEIGYDCEWDCIPAAAVGAPHRRDRVFVVAHPQRESDHIRRTSLLGRWTYHPEQAWLGGSHVANPDVDGQQGQPWPSAGRHEVQPHIRSHADGCRADVGDADCPRLKDVQGRPTVTERPGGRASDRPGWWDVEPDVGRVAHGVPSRVDRLRALGNAVVPQVAEHIGRLIMQAAA